MDKGLTNQNSRLKKYLTNHISLVTSFILLVVVGLITYYRILIQIDMGPVSDSVVFLSNALVFAGHGTGYSDLLRPPLFPFIVSLFFSIGYISATTIFVVDGGLFIFGVLGMFLLLKIRFNDLESFLGALLYSTFPIILINLGLGLTDLPSVSFSIWTFYFLILAVNKNSRFFYLAFPFLMFTFLTRYNFALLIFPILLYILMNKDKINIKNMFIGVGVSLSLIIPVLVFFYQKFGNIIYPFVNYISTSSIVSVSTESTSYNPNTYYYDPNIYFFIMNFPSLVGIQGMIILLIVALGLIFYLFLRLTNNKPVYKNFIGRINLKNKITKVKLFILFILGIIFIASFGTAFYMLSEIIFFAIAYLFYDLTKNMNLKYMKLNVLFFSWAMTFFIFHSVFVIKDLRYFVVMAPPVAYFMILGLSEISKLIKFKVKNLNLTFPIIAIILTSVMLLSAASQIPAILDKNDGVIIFNQQLEMTSHWLVSYDPNYKNENIYSDLWPNFSWYLKTNVKQVPLFKDNYTLNQTDLTAFNQYLVSNNAEYYISVRPGLNLTSYVQIKQFGYLAIYKRINNNY